MTTGRQVTVKLPRLAHGCPWSLVFYDRSRVFNLLNPDTSPPLL
jgi:hypothetical protein